jgi:transcriptional regulator with XRE-family HTH domain
MADCPATADRAGPEAVALRCLGARLRAQRHRLGLTQEALAERIGLHSTYIGQIEQGRRNVGVLNALRFADALAVNPGLLFDRLTLVADARHHGPCPLARGADPGELR